MKNLVLIGFMGSGKSTIGRMAAAELGLNFIDMDRYIEEKEGTSVSQIFSAKGEAFFRDVESQAVEELSERESLVIATGGGVVLKPSNLEALSRKGIVVHLRIDAHTAFARTRSHTHRPLLNEENPLAKIERLLEERHPLYEKGSSAQVDSTGRSPHDVMVRVIEVYRAGETH